jgi:hypothetical protein
MKIVLFTRLLAFAATAAALTAADPSLSAAAQATLKQYCYGCHGKAAMAGLNLQKLSAEGSVGEQFQHWEKVAAVLEEKRMPPAKMPQPTEEQRHAVTKWIKDSLAEYAAKHDGDPGKVTVRRLTSGEYAYTIKDLTGLALRFEGDAASDSVGGEGFTNFGDVQFMQDANLERYLDSAKRIADHAVVGAGPLIFSEDPGKSGVELSAINRINEIYFKHGFRAAAGEGGKPFGLDRYTKAFYAAWEYKNRVALGQPKATLEQLAAREGVSARFIQHIWQVVQDPKPTYPTSEVVTLWRKLPAPTKGQTATARKELADKVRKDCDEVRNALLQWPRFLFAAGSLAAGGAGDERALVITDATLPAAATHKLRFGARAGGKKTGKLVLTSVPLNPGAKDKGLVIWRNAGIRIRTMDKNATPEQQAASAARPISDTPRASLRSLLDEGTVAKLGFGKLPDGTAIGPDDFATSGDSATTLEIPLPPNAAGLGIEVEAELGGVQAGDAVLRLTITGSEEVRGRPTWALLGDPKQAGFQTWKSNVLAFAEKLPQVSQAEAAPSDNDPIPAPFNNTYNQPERNHYHTAIKYYRRDQFLVDKMLDDATRIKLEDAWSDLLTSFEYHNRRIQFVAQKYKLDLKDKSGVDLTDEEMASWPEEARNLVKPLIIDYKVAMERQQAGRKRHLEDALVLASKAWRRPLSEGEKQSLRAFYTKTLEMEKGDHPKAVKALLTRVLVSPAFLYRFEEPPQTSDLRPLSDFELANRLSFFLWASMPDDELLRAAKAGELRETTGLSKQVKRMLADGKARRLATEFFGQWLGFYRFDDFKGVDSTRFPEFTEDVKDAMYDEAVSFFEYIVRNERPVKEMFTANYTFLNPALAKHYGVKKDLPKDRTVKVDGANEFQRGGLLRLGAVLTATSAPLRTSPVKRGDWVLRRILGTPTPPPPPDAGSIPADEKAFGGQSLFEKLQAHQRNATCAGCHTRIDPMGFPLERYDAVGRWRETYQDGKPVQDSAVAFDKTPIQGVDGLLAYLQSQEKAVMRTFSNKLVGYALGRTVLASDLPLIQKMTGNGSNVTFAQLAEQIVTSKQFRYRKSGIEGGTPSGSNTPAKRESKTPVAQVDQFLDRKLKESQQVKSSETGGL